MPAANKVEAIVPNIPMKLAGLEKVLPGEKSVVISVLKTYGNEAAYIFFF